MKLLRLLLVTLCAAAGLVVFTQVPAVACSCAPGTPADHVEGADAVFSGTLVGIEQTNPGGDDVISSGDPVFYTFEVGETFKGEPGDGVVESVRDGATCGLEGMEVDQSYVVFAYEDKSGGLHASLCGGTTHASDRLVERVEAALAEPAEPPAPTATEVPEPLPPVPTQVPSGVESPTSGEGAPAWAWFAGGLLLAVAGGATSLRRRGRTGTRT